MLTFVNLDEVDVADAMDITGLLLPNEGIVDNRDRIELEVPVTLRNVDKITLDEGVSLGIVHAVAIVLYEVVVDAAEVFGKSQDFVLLPEGVEVTDVKVAGYDVSVALKSVEADEGAVAEVSNFELVLLRVTEALYISNGVDGELDVELDVATDTTVIVLPNEAEGCD